MLKNSVCKICNEFKIVRYKQNNQIRYISLYHLGPKALTQCIPKFRSLDLGGYLNPQLNNISLKSTLVTQWKISRLPLNEKEFDAKRTSQKGLIAKNKQNIQPK